MKPLFLAFLFCLNLAVYSFAKPIKNTLAGESTKDRNQEVPLDTSAEVSSSSGDGQKASDVVIGAAPESDLGLSMVDGNADADGTAVGAGTAELANSEVVEQPTSNNLQLATTADPGAQRMLMGGQPQMPYYQQAAGPGPVGPGGAPMAGGPAYAPPGGYYQGPPPNQQFAGNYPSNNMGAVPPGGVAPASNYPNYPPGQALPPPGQPAGNFYPTPQQQQTGPGNFYQPSGYYPSMPYQQGQAPPPQPGQAGYSGQGSPYFVPPQNRADQPFQYGGYYYQQVTFKMPKTLPRMTTTLQTWVSKSRGAGEAGKDFFVNSGNSVGGFFSGLFGK